MTDAAYLQQQSARAAERLRAAVHDHPVIAVTGVAACGLLAVVLSRLLGPATLWRAARPMLRGAAAAIAPGLGAHFSK